jgi:hypothetical protein
LANGAAGKNHSTPTWSELLSQVLRHVADVYLAHSLTIIPPAGSTTAGTVLDAPVLALHVASCCTAAEGEHVHGARMSMPGGVQPPKQLVPVVASAVLQAVAGAVCYKP